MESILTSIKKQLGIGSDYTVFDQDLIFLINASLSHLKQIGVEMRTESYVFDESEKWSDIICREDLIPMCMNFVYIQTRQQFDPPSSSSHSSALSDRLKELEWRITVQASSDEDAV